jgi:RNA polymerase sigma-70 factor (ECF subfamily)
MKRDLFWKLLEREHPKAEAFCRKLTGNKEDGDDLYQDVLLAAWKKFHKLREIDSFRPWIYRIIVNRFKSLYRFNRRRRSRFDAASYSEIRSYDPSNALDARLLLRRLLSVLPPDDRSLVTLYELEGWRIEELGKMFGKPSGTIKSRLSRARKKMKGEILEGLSQEERLHLIDGSKICVAAKQNAD